MRAVCTRRRSPRILKRVLLQLQLMIKERRPNVLKLFSRLYDLSISRNPLTKFKSYDILRSLSLTQSLLKLRNTPIWFIAKRGAELNVTFLISQFILIIFQFFTSSFLILSIQSKITSSLFSIFSSRVSRIALSDPESFSADLV